MSADTQGIAMKPSTATRVEPGVYAIDPRDLPGQPVASNVRAFPLAHIHPNPWQTRLGEDPAHLRALADDIAAHDLLQVPLARPHPDQPGHVQIAFGHSRLAAYVLLNAEHPGPYESFPVDVRPLTDRQLSDFAASENAQRKNLSAIETATAIQKRIKDFGLTQLEAGQPFGYRDAASVSNLLRLLKLPAELQADVHAGALPERIARQAVRVSQLYPKDTVAALKNAAAQPAAEREEAMLSALEDVLESKGRDLGQMPFELNWPAAPIPLNGAATAELAELPACVGCPFLFKRDHRAYCLRPACAELKRDHALTEQLQHASLKLSLPLLALGEKAHPLFAKGLYYTEKPKLEKLLKAARREPEAYNLRVTLKTEERGFSGTWHDVTGSDHVRIVTLNQSACDKFLKALDSYDSSNPVTPKTSPGATHVLTEKERANLEADQAARRAERAEQLRLQADVVWLVQSVTPTIAAQLTISGPVLHYVVQMLSHSSGANAEQFYGLRDWHADLQTRAVQATGKAADEVRRQLLVANSIFEYIFHQEMVKHEGCWNEIVSEIENLASTSKKRRYSDQAIPGLQVRLPKNWSTPPIHETQYNCWRCGTFAGQRRLTQGDLDRGWRVDARGAETLDVQCPDCARQTAPKTTAKKAKK